MSVKLVYEIPETELITLYELMARINIPRNSLDSNRKHFPERYRGMVMGITRGRGKLVVGPSYNTKKYPQLMDELNRIGSLLGLDYTSVQINKNVVCPKHKDSKNVGESVIFSIGNYTGCTLMVDGVAVETKHRAIEFNGAMCEHWNTDDLVGDRWSFIYFKSNY